MKKCFIICPIGSDGSETRKRSDVLFRHIIEPVCSNCEFTPIRVDKENTNNSLTDEIISHITNDDLVIADLTESNPNAFYEIGYRAALNKPLIQLISKDCSIPFDVSVIRTFSYDLLDLDAVEETKKRLIQTIKSIDFNQVNILDESVNTPSLNINIYSQILQEIYNIQDRLEKLSSEINSKDSTAISILADKLAISNTKSPEVALTETLLSKLLDEPEKFANLSKEFGNFTSKKE